MRYAIFTDIHANLEALEAVLAKIDEIAKEKPIDQIWFLGDLVGYGPNPNECIAKLRERTNVIIAGNHDWAAVGRIDLEDFSAAARISAEWTAEQLTEEHRAFLTGLPERLEIDECMLVHGSPYGPLWEYLTSDILAERSFQYFSTRFCFVGHTHVPIIFQQPDTIANTPTLPLADRQANGTSHQNDEAPPVENKDERTEMVAVQPAAHTTKAAIQAESAYANPETGQTLSEIEANTMIEARSEYTDPTAAHEEVPTEEDSTAKAQESSTEEPEIVAQQEETEAIQSEDEETLDEEELQHSPIAEAVNDESTADQDEERTPEPVIQKAEEHLNAEIEELLTLLGLSQSMIQVTNEMIVPPEGHWEPSDDYRAIINPGGVGQPRDGDPRAAFMIYDTEQGFDFYRIPYALQKTQEKIIRVGLPQYLAVRLAYGR